MEQDSFPVTIIGGGLAGLTAALHLAERGIKPLVLEADQLWAGGRLSGGERETFEYQGREWSFPSEHGIHALWGGYGNMRATFIGLGKNLLAAPEESITLTSFIAALRFYTMLRRDTWHPYYLPGDAHSALIQPLIDGIEQRGGKIIYGTTALALECAESGGWRIRVEDQA